MKTIGDAVKYAQLIHEYSIVTGIKDDNLRAYLEDVKSLEGKMPDGFFSRLLTPEEEKTTQGFEGQNFEKYKQCLMESIEDSLQAYERRVNWYFNMTSSKNHTRYFAVDGGTEASRCRDVAIHSTLSTLIPAWDEIFKPRVSRPRLISTGMRGGGRGGTRSAK